jgi:hypothetical protein
MMPPLMQSISGRFLSEEERIEIADLFRAAFAARQLR